MRLMTVGLAALLIGGCVEESFDAFRKAVRDANPETWEVVQEPPNETVTVYRLLGRDAYLAQWAWAHCGGKLAEDFHDNLTKWNDEGSPHFGDGWEAGAVLVRLMVQDDENDHEAVQYTCDRLAHEVPASMYLPGLSP